MVVREDTRPKRQVEEPQTSRPPLRRPSLGSRVASRNLMAESLAHRWGQIIGDCFEIFVRNILADVATRHDLYLDFKRPRNARGRPGKSDVAGRLWQQTRPRLRFGARRHRGNTRSPR